MNNYNILKTYCERIYLVGSGNFWVDEEVDRNDKSLLYRSYSFILLFAYCFMTVLEIMAALLGEFPEDEKSDAVTFAVSHTVVMIKIFSVISHKELVKVMNQKMINVCELHEEESLVNETYRSVKRNLIVYFGTVYGATAFYVFEGLRKVYAGSHFVTIVTYYPAFEDNSLLATSFRIFTTFVLFMMMITMILSVDCFTMAYLIMLKYKYITLRNYFEKLTADFHKLNESGKSRLAMEKLTNGLVEGIIMHNELLKLGKNIDTAFGTVIALQLFQSSGSAVSLLLQIALHSRLVWYEELIRQPIFLFQAYISWITPASHKLSDQLTFVACMKIIFFVIALFFLLGLFLCNAGEITYQASLLSDAIFYCGWHACPPLPPPYRNHQQLVVRACAQALHPPVMKAFKMIELTYATFLTVIRGTYSVFALFHARNK